MFAGRPLRYFASAARFEAQITPRTRRLVDQWHVTEVRPSEVKHKAVQECGSRAELLESLGRLTRDHVDRLTPHAVCPRSLLGLAVEEVGIVHGSLFQPVQIEPKVESVDNG